MPTHASNLAQRVLKIGHHVLSGSLGLAVVQADAYERLSVRCSAINGAATIQGVLARHDVIVEILN